MDFAEKLLRGWQIFFQLLENNFDRLVLQNSIVPSLQMGPLTDVKLVKFNQSRLTEKQNVSNRQSLSTKVKISLVQTIFHEVKAITHLFFSFFKGFFGHRLPSSQSLNKLENHNCVQSWSVRSLIPGEILVYLSPLCKSKAVIGLKLFGKSFTKIGKNSATLSNFLISVSNARDSTKRIDLEKHGSFRFPFQNINNLRLMFDVSDVKKSHNCHAGSAHRVNIGSQRFVSIVLGYLYLGKDLVNSGKTFSELSMDGLDFLVLLDQLVPSLHFSPLTDIEFIYFDIGGLVEYQKVSNGQILPADVFVSSRQTVFQEIKCLPHFLSRFVNKRSFKRLLLCQTYSKGRTHDLYESWPERALVPRKKLINSGSLSTGRSSVGFELFRESFTEIGQDSVALSDREVSMHQTWDSSEGSDLLILRCPLFPFHEINNLPFILDLAQGEESEGCSAGLTDGMVVQSEGHIGYLIKYQIYQILYYILNSIYET